jgi:hypothetical protein
MAENGETRSTNLCGVNLNLDRRRTVAALRAMLPEMNPTGWGLGERVWKQPKRRTHTQQNAE